MIGPPTRAAMPSRGSLALGGLAAAGIGLLVALAGLDWAGAALVLVGVALAAVARPAEAVWATLILLPIHPLASRSLALAGVTAPPFVFISAWKELTIAVVLAVAAAAALRGGALHTRLSTLRLADWLAISLVGLAALGILAEPGLRAINGARSLLFPIGVYVAVRWYPLPGRKVLASLALIGAAVAAVGIVQSSWLGWGFVETVYGDPIPATFTAQHLEGPRAAGTYLAPNEFAFAVAAYLCLAIALVLQGGAASATRWIPIVVLLILGIAMTFSRSTLAAAVVAAAAVVVVSVLRIRPRREAVIALAVAVVIGGTAAGLIYADRGAFALLRSTVDTIADIGATPEPSATPGRSSSPRPSGEPPSPSPSPVDPSTTAHVGSLARGWALVVANPLGVGLGNVGARPMPGSGALPGYIVESWYFAMGLSLGWLGLLWAVAFPMLVAIQAIRSWRSAGTALEASALLGIAVLVAIVGIVLPTMMEPEVAIVPWAVLALVASGARTSSLTAGSAGDVER